MTSQEAQSPRSAVSVGAFGRRVRQSLRTVRGRAAVFVAGTTLLAMSLIVGIVFVLFSRSLQAAVDQTLDAQVSDRAQLLDEGSSPAALTGLRQDESFVWIGTPDGQVVEQGGELVPVENPVPASIGGAATVSLLVQEQSSSGIEREQMQLRMASAPTADGSLVVLAATEAEVIGSPAGQLAGLLVPIVPLIALTAGGLAWISTGRALGPVEGIRRRSEEVSGSSLTERVPVPDSGDEVQHLAETMNAMLERLEQHQVALRQFTADASHELKSPVANLRALVETADPDRAEWPALRAQLIAECERLKDLVDNLLFLATHGEGKSPTAHRPVALDDLLFDEAELVATTGAVAVDIGGVTPVTADGNVAELRRLTRNLVDNAVRHAATKISLACEEVDDGVRLVVGDDGPGIPLEARTQVFERFTRLDTARARGAGGTGLGLAIVRHIVEDHRGTVTIGDSVLGGAEVEVVFPGLRRGGAALPG